MKTITKIIALSIITLLFLTGIVFATTSEPCLPTHPLGFTTSIAQSNLIIVGQKTAESQPGLGVNPATYKPTWFDVKVISVLKGTAKSSTIRVYTSDSGCNDTFPVPDDKNNYLMLFEYNSATSTYERIQSGLNVGETIFKIDNNSFQYYDDDTYSLTNITLDSFAAKYHLNKVGNIPAPQIPLDNNTNQNPKSTESPLLKYIPLNKETIVFTVILVVVLLIIVAWYVSTTRVS